MFNRLSLMQRLLIISLLPLMAALAFVVTDMVQLYREWQTDRVVIDIVGIKPSIGRAVMELQRERGLSAIATSARRGNAADRAEIRKELAAQRPRTDAAIAAFMDAYRDFLPQNGDMIASHAGRRLSKPLNDFANALGNVEGARADMGQRYASPDRVLDSYNGIIDRSYEILDCMLLLAGGAEVLRRTEAFSGIVRARNHVGLERARGGILLLAEVPDQALRSALILERGRQMSWLDVATSMQTGVIRAGIAREIDTELAPMRAALLDEDRRPYFSAMQWFDVATRKAQALADVRTAAVTDLRVYVEAKEEQARRRLQLAAALSLVGLTAFALLLSALIRSIRRSLSVLTSGLDAMAHGDGAHDLDLHNADMTALAPEFRDLGMAMTALRAAEAARRKAEAERMDSERCAHAERSASQARARAEYEVQKVRVVKINMEIAAFEARASEMMAALENAAMELEFSARDLDQIADNTREEARLAHGASGDASLHVLAVSKASDSLATSLSAIRKSIDEASGRAANAASNAEAARARADDLSALAGQIDMVVSVIDDIAAKTNFLALNATIEAAMAGAKQGGFGVIAHELKALTRQTAARAGEINGLVESAKDISAAISCGIADLEGTARDNSVRTARLAQTISDHGGAAAEMNLSMRAAAEASQSVTGAAERVSAISEETRSMSGNLLGAAETVTRTGAAFREVYEGFVSNIRAI
ncbi:MAG: nitrate- and nitrite sensing domain-containing protein [Pacificimonas sp.]